MPEPVYKLLFSTKVYGMKFSTHQYGLSFRKDGFVPEVAEHGYETEGVFGTGVDQDEVGFIDRRRI